MKVLITEDETRIAKRVERFTRELLGSRLTQLTHVATIFDAQEHIQKDVPDLLLLDLNIHGQDGFEVLKMLSAEPFHTIVISAYRDRAITAFEYGVLDFVPKPFTRERLQQAFDRMEQREASHDPSMKYLAIKKKGRIQFLDIKQVPYIKGAGIYTEIQLADGSKEIHDKSLDKLAQLLPNFERIHKSFLVNMAFARELQTEGGGRYGLLLENGEVLPVGRTRYKEIRDRMV